jgi:4-hydroxy-4-methyl-2-oxoglutarate aldolase
MDFFQRDYISSIYTIFTSAGCAQLSDAANTTENIEMGFSLKNFLNISPGQYLCGPVFPVNTMNDMLPCLQAVHYAPEGYIVLLNNQAEESEALAGDILVTECKNAKLGGLVVSGAVRDVANIKELSFPVFAKSINFISAKTAKVPATDVPQSVMLGGKLIETNDWIFGDDDGLYVVKKKYLNALIGGIQIVQQRESELKDALAKGDRLGDICGLEDFVAGKSKLKFEV